MLVISDTEAIRWILKGPRYAFYLGAGASVEANVPSAWQICDEIYRELKSGIDAGDPAGAVRIQELEKKLDWNDPSLRYVSTITAGYPMQAMRVEYFRRTLRGRTPSFVHHAVALLISRGYLKSTCLTTNFDKLLESAFVQQAETECQPLRTDEELRFWMNEVGRHYVLKLHGDYDTHNISNTSDETVMISDAFRNAVATALEAAGLVVLGTAGHEKSIHTLFDFLSRRASAESSLVLRFGLLWSVYMGSSRPVGQSPADLEAAVEEQVRKTIGRDIIKMMSRSSNAAFFPIWGAGNFMDRLIQATGDRLLIGTATRFLDREMRLRRAFTEDGLLEKTITEHLGRLQNRSPSKRQTPDIVSTFTIKNGIELRVVYGDISSRTLMGSDDFEKMRRAVVSPDDTLLTAGGGVAEALMIKGGRQFILNELAKFEKMEQGRVAVTSGGNLPVHYIFHAAALKVEDGSPAVPKEAVHTAVLDALRKADALGVGALWVPLIGTGTGKLSARESLKGILEAIHDWTPSGVMKILMIFIYDFKTLEKHAVDEAIEAAPLSGQVKQPPAAPTQPGVTGH